MTTIEKKIEAYNEAKAICDSYINFKGDKRSSFYKRSQRAVMEVFAARMTNFGKILGMPTYTEQYYN